MLFVFSDDAKQTEYKDILYDMTQCIEDLKSVMLGKRASKKQSPKHKALKIAMYKGIWLTKVLHRFI